MRTDRELLQAALSALYQSVDLRLDPSEELLKEIRARLAEPEDEPVAWLTNSCTQENGIRVYLHKENALDYSSDIAPLYRHPPRTTGLDQLLERIRFLEQQIAERKNK